MQDFDFRALRLVLGPPDSERAELAKTGERIVYVWACGFRVTQEAMRSYCEVRWCAFHRDALLPALSQTGSEPRQTY